MTNEQHNRYIAFAFLANGAFHLLMLLFMAGIFFLIFSIDDPSGQPKPPIELFGVFFGVMFLFQMVFIAPSFVAAYALLKKKSWARNASIVAGIMSSMNVPIGTAACIYSFWFFMGDQWKTVYQSENKFGGSTANQIPFGTETQWDGTRINEKGEVVYQHREPPDWR